MPLTVFFEIEEISWFLAAISENAYEGADFLLKYLEKIQKTFFQGLWVSENHYKFEPEIYRS